MIKIKSFWLISMTILFVVFQFEGAFNLCASDFVQSTSTNDNAQADPAWTDILNALQRLESPREWLTNRPAPEVLVKFRQKQADSAMEVAAKVQEFYNRFPSDPRASEARLKEREILGQAERFGNDKARARLIELDDAKFKDESTSENERFEIRLSSLQRETRHQMTNGMDAALEAYAKGARQLLKEFPKRDEPWEMLLAVAIKASEEKERVLAREIVEGAASEAVKLQARAILKKLELLGKSFELKFTAMDGTEVDLSKMRGKVVLVDFWATWSGPYVAQWPQFKTECQIWQNMGCAIVGINFDTDKETLKTFLAKEKVEWPQYFDGQGWKNKIGIENGIKNLPALWLIDKKGILRDQNARDKLEQKLKKYLAE
jgi:thiol-disulfide isomerase/thioredoxin